MTGYVRRRVRRVTVKRSVDKLRRWPDSWVVTCGGCGAQWYWDTWWMAVRWAESTAEQCCKSPTDLWEAKPARRIDLWGIRTTSSGPFPSLKKTDPLRGAKKED